MVHFEHIARHRKLELCALSQAVMEIYVSHVPAFIAEGKKYLPRHDGAAVKPDLQLNHLLWDVRATTFRAFLKNFAAPAALATVPAYFWATTAPPPRTHP